ncbi:DEAD/DEAH box helicase [Rhodococcus ruber]|uniref:DEAD/DEAH box helicase n=1 Tax=Rhodococcus ruber TaxID=1830 RepID=UPI0011AB62BC|nr:DEAD/DEAH box helicase [Rhodococcus ruber]
MGRLLRRDLADRHGSRCVPARRPAPGGRNRIVEEFQASEGPSILVLSLRALASGQPHPRHHRGPLRPLVNPAVEDQASDRAHRIGQDQPVTIYTLRTAGTVEDHIATMHQRKRGLAQAALSGGEADLLALDDDELYDILRLSPQAQR